MESLRIVFYHTRDILKGRGIRVFLALFMVSLVVMLYTEALQLTMDIDGTPYMLVSLISSLVNIIVMYIVQFLFIKAVRKESFTLKDIRYGLIKSPIFIVLGLMLTFMQVAFLFVCSFLGGLYWLYLVLYTLIYAFFLMWNAFISFGVYDGANFSQLLSGGLYIMKEHMGEVFMAALPIMIWNILGRLIVPQLTEVLLGNTLYAGLIIPGIIKGISISALIAVGISAVNIVYYGVQYACMMPMYTYLAKLYNEDRFVCMPSGSRFLKDDEESNVTA